MEEFRLTEMEELYLHPFFRPETPGHPCNRAFTPSLPPDEFPGASGLGAVHYEILCKSLREWREELENSYRNI